MDKWVDRFREVAQPKKQKSANIEAAISLNGMSADLHHKFTPCILLIFTLVIFYPFFISSPINCFVSQPTGAPTASVAEEKFLNNYCFSLSTYTVFNYLEPEMVPLEPLLYPGVGPETSETEQTRHNYYQFVPYVLLLQCIFFRVSYYWWKNGAHQEAGLIRKLVGYLDDVEMSIAQEPHPTALGPKPSARPHRTVHFFEPARNSTQIIEGGPRAVDTPRDKSDGEESTERSKLEQVVDYCHRRLGGFTVLGSMWLFCDSLALVITVFNFFITDWLLGGVFFSYGLSAMNLDWVGADGQTVNFPRMTKCRVGKYGASGSVENRDALCVLGLNLYYSYMFLFLWCWYIALFIITLCAFIYKLFRIALLKFAPEYFVMSARGTVTRLPVAELARCVSAMTPSDLVFFCLLCQNLRPKTCLAFVNALAAKFKGEMVCEIGVLPYVTVALVLVSPWIFNAKSPLRFYGKFVAYYGITSMIAVFYIPFCLISPRDVAHCRRSSYITRHVAKLIGISYKLENSEILAEDRGAVIVSNHQSTVDILGLFNIWEVPSKVAAIARKEVFYVWPFGLAAYLAGVVFIDRSTPEKAYQTLQETAKLIYSDKVKLWLFPEGTRNKDVNQTRKLKPFKRGAFKLAVHCQAPVIPVVFSPYYFMDAKTNYFGRGQITIRPLEPIPTTGLKEEDIPALMEKTHAAMQVAFDELCARVEAQLPPSHPFITERAS